MTKTTNIAHPLKNRTGLSQQNRVKEALDPGAAPVDGKTLADRLHLIGEYARIVNFYQYKKDKAEGELQETGNWTPFFKESLPFRLADLSKTSVDAIEEQFLLLSKELEDNPSKQTLQSLLDFIYDRLIQPVAPLYHTVETARNSFGTSLLSAVKSSYMEPLKIFISLYNASAVYLCIPKRDFSLFLALPWQLTVKDIYAIDSKIKQVKKGKKQAFLNANTTVNGIFYPILNGFRDIVEAAPDYLEESLLPLEESLQKKHQPHLALLFTFLELFRHFQGNINGLTKKHLDFFYEKVLKMVPKDAVPDKAHIVFEVAKHLQEYPLPKDLLLKDGKDANAQDIQFGLDHRIILDKAQVKDLRTLSLYPVKGNANNPYIEGVYIAPVANSADGKGEEFQKEQSLNWATLGDKYSKFFKEGKDQAEEHPKARQGFILASPVLLLEEGKRLIHISLKCNFKKEEGQSQDEFDKEVEELKEILKCFSGEKGIYDLPENMLNDFSGQLPNNKAIPRDAKSQLNEFFRKQHKRILFEEDVRDFLKKKKPDDNSPIFTQSISNKVINFLEKHKKSIRIFSGPLFKFAFSGKKEWLEPLPENIVIAIPAPVGETMEFRIQIDLGDEFPPVVFYDEENLEEKIDLKEPFPQVKIELNPELELTDCLPDNENDDACCLKIKKGKQPGKDSTFSPYHFLQKLILIDVNIEVKVCGVKNLIVQNDENLQDVNKPVYPFGSRPKVGEEWFIDGGAGFYIGSKEIFCKNWQKFWINTTWKDKPLDLHEYYRFYRDPEFENGDEAITELSFRFLTSILHNGEWIKDNVNNTNPPHPTFDNPGAPNYDKNYSADYANGELMPLFQSIQNESNPCGSIPASEITTYGHQINETFFAGNGYSYTSKSMPFESLQPLTVNSRKGFIKLTLAGTSFQHDRFTYVLTRQMMALADLVDPQSIADSLAELEAMKKLAAKANETVDTILLQIEELIDDVLNPLRNQIGSDFQINSIINLIVRTQNKVNDAKNDLPANPVSAENSLDDALGLIDNLKTRLGNLADSENLLTVHGRINKGVSIINSIKDEITRSANAPLFIFPPFNPNNVYGGYIDAFLDEMGLKQLIVNISSKVDSVLDKFDTTTEMGLPKEPYTPLIKSLTIDYYAIAKTDDIDFIHLYPYENTSKYEDIKDTPHLLPFFNDEGTLFIGIENITPAGQLSVLFQLAEATADSESDRAIPEWYYLTNNNWEPLRRGFEIVSDETDGLTVSGIVTINVPRTIGQTGNTIMPEGLYWIKVSTPSNARAVAETIGIHTQAAKASARFSNLNDKSRLAVPLEAGSIAKLAESDFSVKKTEQPYPSFGGRQAEISGHFYVRVSEHLRHKGRGITQDDCEKIVLEGFPEVYKVKCISHAMGLSANTYRRDLEIAPGYAIVAVIPDLTRLVSGDKLEPRAPVSLLEKIGHHIRKKISPFARIKVMNPRYEPVNVRIAVKLHRGLPAGFYAKKLKEDITLFLAPWYLGSSEKIAFGQEVYFSDIVGFVEQLDYIDYIKELCLKGECDQEGTVIKPLTARSVLTGGDIHVCILEECYACGDEEQNEEPFIVE